MKRILIVAALAACALALGASSVWEGSAVQGGAGDFPAEGLYGACNSFPKNSKVEVENLENGKKALVTITGTVGNPGIFIALSPSAAKELGMKAGNAARVRVLAEPAASVPAPALPPRPGESSDPDFNPKLLALRERAAPASAAAKPAVPAKPPAAAQASAAEPEAGVALLLKPSEPPAPEKAEAASVVEPTARKAPEPKALAAAVPEPAPAAAEPKAVPAQAEPSTAAAATIAAAPLEPAPLEPAPELPAAAPPAAAPKALAESPVLPEAIVKVDAKPAETAAADIGLPDPEERGEVAEASDEGPSVLGLEAAALPEGSEELASLDEPGLRPDELPEESLARLENPPASPLDFALAEGEIDMAEREKAEALALESPAAIESLSEAELAEAEAPTEAEAEPLEAVEVSALEPQAAGEAPGAALAEPEPGAEAEVAAAVPAGAEEAEADLAVSLEPTASRPPAATAATAAPAKTAAAPSGPLTLPVGLPRLERLAKGSFYIQVGVYTTNETLNAAVKGFKGGYPLAIEEMASGGSRYRLYVGPLSRDEGGVVLSRVKAMGFRDAFIRQGT